MESMLLWLTLTIWYEGRSEHEVCQVKIGQVVLNRLDQMGPLV